MDLAQGCRVTPLRGKRRNKLSPFPPCQFPMSTPTLQHPALELNPDNSGNGADAADLGHRGLPRLSHGFPQVVARAVCCVVEDRFAVTLKHVTFQGVNHWETESVEVGDNLLPPCDPPAEDPTSPDLKSPYSLDDLFGPPARK